MHAERDEPRFELVRILQTMVERPEDVRVSAVDKGETTTFVARFADEDLGKVIGRQGRTARALRTVLEVRGEQDQRTYALELRES